jgi:hypothetical protein
MLNEQVILRRNEIHRSCPPPKPHHFPRPEKVVKRVDPAYRTKGEFTHPDGDVDLLDPVWGSGVSTQKLAGEGPIVAERLAAEQEEIARRLEDKMKEAPPEDLFRMSHGESLFEFDKPDPRGELLYRRYVLVHGYTSRYVWKYFRVKTRDVRAANRFVPVLGGTAGAVAWRFRGDMEGVWHQLHLLDRFAEDTRDKLVVPDTPNVSYEVDEVDDWGRSELSEDESMGSEFSVITWRSMNEVGVYPDGS